MSAESSRTWRGRPVGRPKPPVVGLAAGGLVLSAATVVAIDGVPRWEEQLYDALNGGSARIELVLWAPMQLGSLFGPFVVAGLAGYRWRTWRPSAGAVVAGVGSWQLAKVLKAAVERGRPFELVERFVRRMGTPMEGLGFVSGHSAVAFSLAAVCSPYLSRRARSGAYALAVVVGVSRIQVSAHLPLDVVGGAALGYLLGQGWNLVVGVPLDVDPVDHPDPGDTAEPVDPPAPADRRQPESGTVDPGRS